jgi:hypothetical protein
MATQADCRGDPVSAASGPAVADVAAVFSAVLDGAALVLSVAGQQAVVVIESYTAVDQSGCGVCGPWSVCHLKIQHSSNGSSKNPTTAHSRDAYC